MVTLEKIREEMKERLDIDTKMHNVDVNADNIDEALADAAVQLDTKTGNLEYEVVEKGSTGFLGLGKKPWKIRVYQNPNTITKTKKSSGDDLFSQEEPFFSGVMKVSTPAALTAAAAASRSSTYTAKWGTLPS